jgi:glycine/D-amino acid oxidase-like deaminating enzyme/nitrite reductase/ring-hydroxylating ferredoxin subunit
MANLFGTPISYWIDSTQLANYPKLSKDVIVDVAIVGGGIAGLTTAALLKKSGKTVAVLEARQIATAASGHTTAKVTSLHQIIYSSLIKKIGEEKARLYAEANQAGVERIAKFVAEEGIDCDFSRTKAYTFAETEKALEQVEDEVKAAHKLGLPVSFTSETSLPFPIKGAVQFDNQAQFHVRKYLLHLAQMIAGNGSFVFENTQVKSIEDGHSCQVFTDYGVVSASDVVVATNLPMMDEGLYFAKTFSKRSYLIGAAIAPEKAPQGMFIGAEEEYYSIRTTPYQDKLLLLIGGGGHKVGTVTQTEDSYRKLETFARERFDINAIQYRWSSQDVVSFDKIPYVGKLTPMSQHIYVATGFSLWGMSNGTISGMLLTDLILGRENAWLRVFDSTRATPFLTPESAKNNLEVTTHWIGDRLKGLSRSLDQVAIGEGELVTVDGHKVAAYRDESGTVHAVSAVCTHLGCIVNWNSAERSWDCPCHGARFSCDGKVLNGPALKDLQAIQNNDGIE